MQDLAVNPAFTGRFWPALTSGICSFMQISIVNEPRVCYARRPVDKADTAWMLVSTALVLLMTPALGFFYGGLVRSKNALNTMMMSVSSLGFVGVGWALAGYSLAFAPGSALVGGFSRALLSGVGLEPQGTIPHLLFMAYQGTFAIITAALISGAIVERMRFGPYLAFLTLWGIVVYAPVAHWVWGGGLLSPARRARLCRRDGRARQRRRGGARRGARARPAQGLRAQAILPHNVPFTLLGAGLLWFGWFGFNAGSALGANASAALAFVNTMLAPAATLVVWTLLDLARTGRATAVGAATAIVVGLVAVTPAAGFVAPLSAILLGGDRRLPELLRAPLARAHAARRLARRRRGARRRRDRRRAPDGSPRAEGLERRPPTASSSATRGSSRSRRSRSWRSSPTAARRPSGS